MSVSEQPNWFQEGISPEVAKLVINEIIKNIHHVSVGG